MHRRVAGDIRAVQRLERPFLHAARLAFTHPRDGRRMEFIAPLPDDLRSVLDDLPGWPPKRRRRVRRSRCMNTPIVPREIRTVYRGPHLHACRSRSITLPKGGELERRDRPPPGSVVIVPVTDAGEIILVRQYRHAIGRWAWELPAGSLKPGEDVERRPRRECQEEIGLIPSRLERLGVVLPDARLLRRGDELLPRDRPARARAPATRPRSQDEDEDIEAQAFALADVRRDDRDGRDRRPEDGRRAGAAATAERRPAEPTLGLLQRRLRRGGSVFGRRAPSAPAVSASSSTSSTLCT